MIEEEKKQRVERPPPLGGGPLGLGDPDDLRLRKTESDIIIPKMMREEAEKRCSDLFKLFYDCAKDAGILLTLKCRKENNARNDCIIKWFQNPELKKEMTEKYLEARSHYRRTGEPLIKFERGKKSGGGFH